MFGGRKHIVILIADLLKKEFEKMIQNKNMNNEQLALAIIWRNNKDLFHIIKNFTNEHLPLFDYLRC